MRDHRRRNYNVDPLKTTPMAIYEDPRNLACGSTSSRHARLETLPPEGCFMQNLGKTNIHFFYCSFTYNY